MIRVYLDGAMRVIKSEIPVFITQYSSVEIEIHTPIQPENQTTTYSFIRPDGYKTHEVYMSYDREEDGKYVWVGELTPYHTSNMPGSSDTGVGIMSFTMRHNITGLTLSSPIIRLTIQRSIEPAPNIIPPNLADSILARLDKIEEEGIDISKLRHDQLTAESRSLPDQHPIEAITGLKPEINVHVGREEPQDLAKTWFKKVDKAGEDNPNGEWITLMSFIKLEQDAAFVPQLEFDNHEPMRFIIIGNLGDDTVTQELHIDANGVFKGEVIIIADPVANLYSSVEIEIKL